MFLGKKNLATRFFFVLFFFFIWTSSLQLSYFSFDIMASCWSGVAGGRPTFSLIIASLEKTIQVSRVDHKTCYFHFDQTTKRSTFTLTRPSNFLLSL